MTSFIPLLCVAIGFSWEGFLSTFSTKPDTSTRHLALITASARIFPAVVAVSFADRTDAPWGLLINCGLAICLIAARYVAPAMVVLVSAAGSQSTFAALLTESNGAI